MSVRAILQAALQELEVAFWVDEDGMLVVPLTIDGATGGRTLVMVNPDETGRDVLMWAGVCEVPLTRRRFVLQLLNEFNSKRRWVRWSLHDNLVVLDVDVELGFSADPQGQVQLAFRLFQSALIASWRSLVRVASQGQSRSRVDREIAAILSKLDGPSASSAAE